MDGEDTLDAFAEGDAADRERLVRAAAATGDDGAGVDLDAFLVAFLDLDVHADAVADLELRGFRLQLRIFNLLQKGILHGFLFRVCLKTCAKHSGFLSHVKPQDAGGGGFFARRGGGGEWPAEGACGLGLGEEDAGDVGKGGGEEVGGDAGRRLERQDARQGVRGGGGGGGGGDERGEHLEIDRPLRPGARGLVVVARGTDIVDVEAVDIGEPALEPAVGIDEAEIVAYLAMADVPPQAQAAARETPGEALALDLRRERLPGGEDFQGEMDARLGEDGEDGLDRAGQVVHLALGALVAGDLGAELQALVFLRELAAQLDHADELVGKALHVEVARMADDRAGADLRGEAERPRGMLHGELPLLARRGAHGIDFRAGAHRADRDRAEIVDRIALHGARGDGRLDARDQLRAQIVADLDAGEAQGEDLLHQGLPRDMAAGVPARRKGKTGQVGRRGGHR